MRKRFFASASLAVIGSGLLSVIVSIIYFCVSLNIDDGTSIIVFLGYLTDVCNAIAMFIGFGTIIFAFWKFGFYDGIMSLLLFFAAFLPYFIYQSVTWNIYANLEYDVVFEAGNALPSILMGIYYSMGSGIINQILPSALIGFIACKVISGNTDEPTKFISTKNKLQKSMIVSCVSLAIINFVTYLLTGLLPTLISIDFIFSSSAELWGMILEIFITLIELSVIYLVLGYVLFMLTFKFYMKKTNDTSKLKKVL